MTSSVTAGNGSDGAEHAHPPCLFCREPLHASVVDLGKSPLCETFLEARQLREMEPFYPLHVFVCTDCWLVQLPEHVTPEGIFTDYPYFSSYSDSWLDHARRYVNAVVDRFGLDDTSQVVELGSNDGYLLRFVIERGIPALGVEPAPNVAAAAEAAGVPTEVAFFGRDCARRLVERGQQADLVAGANVMAQVPDPNDFLAGIALLLKPDGVCTIEFPHLVNLVEHNQFDTIYQEHFFYFSLSVVQRMFATHGLRVFDVEELPTHGGSLRIYATHQGSARHVPSQAVDDLLKREAALGVETLAYYANFAENVMCAKRRLLRFLIDARDRGESVVGYGAPGKGNTLLNYCGIRTDLLAWTVDRNPRKQGRYTPGTHIPICHPDRIAQERPDIVLILPWNLEREIAGQLSYIAEWGGRLAVPIPYARLLDPA